MNTKVVGWTIFVLILVGGMSLFGQQVNHISPKIQAACSDNSMPPALRAGFCKAAIAGAQTQPPSHHFPRPGDATLTRPEVQGGSGKHLVAQDTSSETVLHSFAPSALNGANPNATPCLGPGGVLYGTTANGGSGGAGVVYRVNSAGHAAVLYNFTGGADGGSPNVNGVLCNSAGNIYGATTGGGSAGAGVVFRVDGAGHESVLYSFTGGADGGYPYTNLIQDSAGNLYGTASGGGAYGAGVVFKVDKHGGETVLYAFTGGADGSFPYGGGVVQDASGNFYGATAFGGSYGNGVVFKLDSLGNEAVVYTFTGGADGAIPISVVHDSAGNLYGTTYAGGSSACYGGCGVVFKVDSLGNETVLYAFTGGADGGYPYSGSLVMDSAGNLYGATNGGGSHGAGVVFKIDPSGNEIVLYNFTGGTDGGSPYASVVRDSAGNLYGSTSNGGYGGIGTVFKLDPAGHETVLDGFLQTGDGSDPWAGVIRDSAGNLYGTTVSGGANGAGIVFKLDSTGRETMLYTFTGGADGANPYAGVILDSSGNLYGTTSGGGTAHAGVVYKLDTTGHQTVLYTFTGGADGAGPNGGLIFDSAGNLYGTTSGGGALGWGVVYKLDPVGHETLLYTFTGGNDGGQPNAGVIRDSAGNLYGTTVNGYPTYPPGYFLCGVVYKLDPSGHQTVLHRFGVQDGDGWYLLSGVILDSAGNLYGTTYFGGADGNPGTVYKLDPAGNETLYSFSYDGGGFWPAGGVVFDSAGNLYGTTTSGPGFTGPGGTGSGVVYEITPGLDSPVQQQPVQKSFRGLDLSPKQ